MIGKIRDRISLLRAEKHDKSRDEIIRLLFEVWDLLHKKGKYTADKYLNTSIYILLVNRDLFYLYNLFYFEKSSSKKNLYARLLSMTIFEYLLDINELIGRDMIHEIKTNNWNPDLIVELKRISKSYSLLKRKFEKDLKNIRNNAAAHKTIDARKLFEFSKREYMFLKSICPVMRLIEIEFEKVSTKFDEISK